MKQNGAPDSGLQLLDAVQRGCHRAAVLGALRDSVVSEFTELSGTAPRLAIEKAKPRRVRK